MAGENVSGEIKIKLITETGEGETGKEKPEPKKPDQQKKDDSKNLTWLAAIGKYLKKVSPVFDLSNIIVYLLRKSQVIMGILDPLLDVIGAVIDTLLMPLVPLLVPVIKMIAGSIPAIQVAMDVVTGFLSPIATVLNTVAKWVQEGAAIIKKWLGGGAGGAVKNIGKEIFMKATPIGMGISAVKSLWHGLFGNKEPKQSGIAYVPHTMTAELHRGESVLNARETQKNAKGNPALIVQSPQFIINAGGTTTMDAKVFGQQLYREFTRKLTEEARRS